MTYNLLQDAINGLSVTIPFNDIYGRESDMYPTFWSQQQFNEWLTQYGLGYTVDPTTNHYHIFKT